MRFFQRCKKAQNYTFPVGILYERWQHPRSQTHFLQYLFQNPAELFAWPDIPKRPVNLDTNPTLKANHPLNVAPVTLQQFWTSLDFIELLLDLSQTSEYLTVRILFDFPIMTIPDILILGKK
jgi:hypothetical protein